MSVAKVTINEVLSLLFPLLRLKSANRSIDKKIELFENGDTPEFSYMAGYDQLTSEEAENYLSKTFEARKNLEDKAKTNVFGVTISVSLIVGFAQLFTNSNYYANTGIKIIVSALIIYSLVSVVVGTVISLLILGKYNRIYDVYPTNKADTPEELVKNIAINAELNSLYNIKRNNLLYSSYGLIINFLISVSISFIVVILFVKKPVDESSNTKSIEKAYPEMRDGLISYNNQLRLQVDENIKISNRLNSLEKEVDLIRQAYITQNKGSSNPKTKKPESYHNESQPKILRQKFEHDPYSDEIPCYNALIKLCNPPKEPKDAIR